MSLLLRVKIVLSCLKKRQQALNGVSYAKPYVTKLRQPNYSFGSPRNEILNESIKNYLLNPCCPLKKNVCVLSYAQLFCHPMDCSMPGLSDHGVFQARILEWVPISFFKGSKYLPGVEPASLPPPALAGRFFTTIGTTWEVANSDDLAITSLLICLINLLLSSSYENLSFLYTSLALLSVC